MGSIITPNAGIWHLLNLSATNDYFDYHSTVVGYEVWRSLKAVCFGGDVSKEKNLGGGTVDDHSLFSVIGAGHGLRQRKDR